MKRYLRPISKLKIRMLYTHTHTHTHTQYNPTYQNSTEQFSIFLCVYVWVCVVLKITCQNVSNGYLREGGQVGGEETGTEDSDQGGF